jgi:hypothetical protein
VIVRAALKHLSVLFCRSSTHVRSVLRPEVGGEFHFSHPKKAGESKIDNNAKKRIAYVATASGGIPVVVLVHEEDCEAR